MKPTSKKSNIALLKRLSEQWEILDAIRPRNLNWALLCVDNDNLLDWDADEKTRLAKAQEILREL